MFGYYTSQTSPFGAILGVFGVCSSSLQQVQEVEEQVSMRGFAKAALRA